MVYDPDAQAQVTDGLGNIITIGERVRSVVLDDGRVIVENGVAAEDGPSINLATTDVLARGGNAFPLGNNSFTTIGIPLHQALANFLAFELRGGISGQAYPPGGEGRISTAGDAVGQPLQAALDKWQIPV